MAKHIKDNPELQRTLAEITIYSLQYLEERDRERNGPTAPDSFKKYFPEKYRKQLEYSRKYKKACSKIIDYVRQTFAESDTPYITLDQIADKIHAETNIRMKYGTILGHIRRREFKTGKEVLIGPGAPPGKFRLGPDYKHKPESTKS